MLFPEEDAALLKGWIVKRIENTSDADTEVLADYIIALLKHDGDKKSIRELCEKEIPDFLTEDPKAFLDDVFQAIAYKSYLPGAPPPPKFATANPTPLVATTFEPNSVQAALPPSGPRKRGYRDFDAPTGPNDHYDGSRLIKNPRRAGNGPSRGGMDIERPVQLSPMAPSFDPQKPMPMDMFMGMGMPMPGGLPSLPAPVSSRGGRSRRRGRCRDFDNKGYCSRGTTCPYDHGNESSFGSSMAYPGGEYTPEDPLLAFQAMYNQIAQMPLNMESNRGRGGRRGARSGKKGGSRAPFSAEGPIQDRSKTAIVVENIPEENFSEEEVQGFFSQFGNVEDIQMQPYKRLAIVKYDKWGSANAAYKSHKAIFDNRFVKVFWYKEPSGPEASQAVNGAKSNSDVGEDAMDVEPDLDPEEFQRRQEEAQKNYQERENKRAEIERQRQELEKKQQELLDRHREETERLRSKLSEKNGGDGQASTPATGAAALRAKLALLESEAKILGIDPDAAESPVGSFPARGGGYRGRGGFPPRGRGRGGGRGGFGNGEGRHAAYAQYSIDNRPKKLAITGVDFSLPEKDEGLRHFLLNLGEFESIEPSSQTTYVSFQDRKTAETLYNTLNGKELPGIDGTLDIQWVNGTSTKPRPAPPSTAPKSKQGLNQDEGGDGMVDGEDESKPGRQDQKQHQEQVEMDYEQPDDDDDAY